MGDPRKPRKQYEVPKRQWDKRRIEEESALREEFGLKNARELWKMQTVLRRIRREARRVLSKKGADLERRTSQLLSRVTRLLIRNAQATVDDVLQLTTPDLPSRRLQTVVVKKHMANTPKQARQFIVHGHVSNDGRKVSSPSYLVAFEQEDKIGWFKRPLEAGPGTAKVEEAKAA